MKQIQFSIERVTVGGVLTSAYVDEDESPFDALKEEAWRELSINVDITVGDVTMFAAAWEDPEHWAEDWATKFGIDHDEVGEFVAQLLEEATTDG